MTDPIVDMIVRKLYGDDGMSDYRNDMTKEARWSEKRERNIAIVRGWLAGATLTALAVQHELTIERIRQIVRRDTYLVEGEGDSGDGPEE